MSDSNPQGGERWGSRIGVILAVAGSAVGLGNFLRFPGQAAQNGGGAFMLPYFISLLILGIPLCWAEWTMGRYGGTKGFNSAPGIFQTLWRNPLSKYLGSIALLIPLVIYMYYVVIEAWCLGYAFNYLTGDLMLGADSEKYSDFFGRFVGTGADGALLTGESNLILFLLITFVLNFILIYRGISKGIESFCKIAMPIMVICAVCVLARVLTLGGEKVVAGLGAMWNPNAEYLMQPKTWLAASGQIFFSLSVGFGVVINYASYLKKNDDIALSGLTASSMNEFFEVCLGGLITLPAAFIFLGAAAKEQGTFGLGFNALPNVFAVMPGGRFFGFLWFFMLFTAAITSSLSMLQPVIAFFEEGLGLKRHASATLLGLVSAMGSGFVVYFSKGMVALDTFDFWVGTMFIFILAMIQAVIYGWVFGIQKGYEELHRGANIRVPWFVQIMLKYVTPAYLLAIFIGICITQGPDYAKTLSQGGIPLLSIMFILTIWVFLLLLINIAGKRWIAEGRFDAVTHEE
ncbi:sodium-dependent transporter [Bythopirellula polymerisocia]|uniref:Sodium:neurotransmitter symporter family protein n=1 Tax=Bythopirellula polymerisocia TaxID=2528003 RepID=A0A5C6C605_9BACT|nr:sodium-dependent transporter [Bythopirellula polymerisocia]TWU20070.1 Sodium:neurotransmitter symporter family protein [Bythopirellula polymerisocia]